MHPVAGTPVNINGRTGGTPGPATTTPVRVAMPVPQGRQKLSGPPASGFPHGTPQVVGLDRPGG